MSDTEEIVAYLQCLFQVEICNRKGKKMIFKEIMAEKFQKIRKIL